MMEVGIEPVTSRPGAFFYITILSTTSFSSTLYIFQSCRDEVTTARVLTSAVLKEAIRYKWSSNQVPRL